VDCNTGRREPGGRLEHSVAAANELIGSLVSQGAVRPLIIVFHAPGFQDDSGFQEGAEEFPVEAFIPKFAMEALDMAVFPRRTRCDIESLDLLGRQPVLDGISDELGSVVAS